MANNFRLQVPLDTTGSQKFSLDIYWVKLLLQNSKAIIAVKYVTGYF